MRTIITITYREKRTSMVDKKDYWRTYAVLDDGTEAIGWSKSAAHYQVNDQVEVFLHRGIIKMRKGQDARDE